MKKTAILTFILFLFIMPIFVSANEISTLSTTSISGKITSYEGINLAKVNVTAITKINKESISFEATTDYLGTYAFYNLPKSDEGYTIVTKLDGYCSAGREKIAESGSIVDLKLYKSNFYAVESPIIFVSAGQSGGVYTTSAICDLGEIKYDWAYGITYEHLESGVGLSSLYAKVNWEARYLKKSNFSDGTQYKTIVFVMGYPRYGSSTVTFETELNRLIDMIFWAKLNNVSIIGMHVEGSELRNDYSNETIINLVAPYCDMLVIVAASNYDDKFTEIAIEYDIPLHVAAKVKDLVPIFVEIFKESQA